MPDSSPASQGYALFDLDQTIVPWDTQLLFCNFVLKREPLRRLHVLGLIPFLPLTKVLGAGGMKRVFLNYLAGLDAEVLDSYAREFVEELIPNGLYGEVVEMLREHQKVGRLTILNSASPEIWVKYIAEKLGFDHYFGTQIQVAKTVSLFPDMIGENNKGEAKIQRMKHLFPEGWKEGELLPDSFGYSDSQADLPMLRICEQNTMVHPTPKLLAAGEEVGWQLVHPARPTANKMQFGIACAMQALGVY